MVADRALVAALRDALAAQARPERAPAMQAYMKSTLPFWGIDAPTRRRTVAAVAAQHPLAEAQALRDTVLAMWRGARHREERYAALDLLRLPRLRPLIDLQLLPVLHELIESGAWWDHNDDISGFALPLLLQAHPAALKPVLRQWARSDSLWLRRAAILCQRGVKNGFDAVLLYDCILPSIGDAPLASEFFIRKGIGWALRQRSYAAAAEVQAFCDAYGPQLSALTRREALRAVSRRAAGVKT